MIAILELFGSYTFSEGITKIIGLLTLTRDKSHQLGLKGTKPSAGAIQRGVLAP